MPRTFCTSIRDPAADAILSPMANRMGQAMRWAFREIHVKKRPLADVKRECLTRFGITARQFNGVRYDLNQAVAAWKGVLQHRITTLRDRSEKLEDEIGSLSRRLEEFAPRRPLTPRRRQKMQFKLHGKKRHRQTCLDRKTALELELGADRPRLCFGGRSALRDAMASGDMARWRDRRSGRIFLVGSKDETAGNQSCQWDGERLSLKLPDTARGERATLQGVVFRYGQAELLAARQRGQAVTWLLFRDEAGQWQARATIDEPPAALVTDLRAGVIAVDLNEAHLAVTFVNRMGNPLHRETLPFPVAGTDQHVASAIIGEAIAQLCGWAVPCGYGIAIEKLDFSRKKSALKMAGPRHARRLSGMAYAAFGQILQARCARDGVDLVQVNPAFTSIIGGKKYAPWRGLTRHHAAALVIGRRAMGFGERLVCMDGVTLGGPGRNLSRHVPSRWRNVRPWRAQEGATASARTARSVLGRDSRGRPARAGPGSGDEPGLARTSAFPAPGGAAVGPPIRLQR